MRFFQNSLKICFKLHFSFLLINFFFFQKNPNSINNFQNYIQEKISSILQKTRIFPKFFKIFLPFCTKKPKHAKFFKIFKKITKILYFSQKFKNFLKLKIEKIQKNFKNQNKTFTFSNFSSQKSRRRVKKSSKKFFRKNLSKIFVFFWQQNFAFAIEILILEKIFKNFYADPFLDPKDGFPFFRIFFSSLRGTRISVLNRNSSSKHYSENL